ncbi:hypothetical protein CDD80_6956 [Ophiocordyceps camponoti-rufipedis]|uniref:Uncharacterized protein n=1 Tax=Ophiocordyceps camponoti-rufipedis TaxID=2004952 RepID=A0A2C5YNV2_9HYPO|nr:hypothetical protein CDD80_6956 [Ophiocordyceps camponoti-rufipedis]
MSDAAHHPGRGRRQKVEEVDGASDDPGHNNQQIRSLPSASSGALVHHSSRKPRFVKTPRSRDKATSAAALLWLQKQRSQEMLATASVCGVAAA